MTKPLALRLVVLRWLNVALRSTHLAAVIFLGAAILGAPAPAAPAAAAVALSGAAMFAVDLLAKPMRLFEAAGLSVIVKILLEAWMAADASLREPLFWFIVLFSAVFAHAPASVRHASLPLRRGG